jgi:hypothetical protein
MASKHVPALMRAADRWLPWILVALAAVASVAEIPGKAEKPDTAEKADTTEKSETAEKTETALSLTASQQRAVGLQIEHPLPLTTAPPIQAFGTVLDPVALVTDMGRVDSTQVTAAAAAADVARLERLYHDNTQASLKAVQAAQAQSVEAAAQARAAALSFRLQWGPLAAWSEAQRRSLLEAVSRGELLLLRADVPGQRLGGAIERRAVVEVDGVNIAARVLGQLPRTDASSQSLGWLLQLERNPEALGPGAHVAVRLQAAAIAGLLVPATALLYSEHGTYVYRQLNDAGADTFHYAAVAVRPLARVGSAWLVDGLERTDRVVVEGAGVLWSQQGIGTFSAAEEEHD